MKKVFLICFLIITGMVFAPNCHAGGIEILSSEYCIRGEIYGGISPYPIISEYYVHSESGLPISESISFPETGPFLAFASGSVDLFYVETWAKAPSTGGFHATSLADAEWTFKAYGENLLVSFDELFYETGYDLANFWLYDDGNLLEFNWIDLSKPQGYYDFVVEDIDPTHEYKLRILAFVSTGGGDRGLIMSVNLSSQIPPAQAIEDLVNIIEAMNLQKGINNSLDVKLQAAQDAIEALNADLRNDAIHKLEAFINAVEAQRGKTLTDVQADLLVGLADDIISDLY